MDEVARIARAAGIVGFFTLLSRITGLLRDMVVGYLFGALGAADAFFVAFRIPNLLRRLTAEGALTAGFIPVFTDYLTNRGRDEAMRIARIVFTFAGLFLAALTVAGMVFAPQLTELFAPGFKADEEKFTLTVLLTRLMFPYIFFVSLVALAMGVLNSLRHFMAPALSPVLLNLSIVFCALLLAPFFDRPVIALGVGVLVGGAAQLILQLPYLSREGFRYAADYHFNDPSLKRLLLLMGPMFFGAAIYQINVLVSTMLASLLPEGSVSYLYYADRLLQFPLGIFAVALGTAALPSFSSLAARKDFDRLRESLSYSLGLVNFVSLPATLGLMALAVPIFSLLFQRGAFDEAATLGTAQALVFYSLGLWAVSGIRLVVPVFYALEDTRTPVWVAFWSFLLNFFFSLVLMGEISSGAEPSRFGRALAAISSLVSVFSLSHGGLALATALSATFNFLALLWILTRRLRPFPLKPFFFSFRRALLGSMLMALPLLGIARQVNWVAADRSLWSHGALFLLLLALGISLYFMLSRVLRSPEWPLVLEVGSKMRRRILSNFL